MKYYLCLTLFMLNFTSITGVVEYSSSGFKESGALIRLSTIDIEGYNSISDMREDNPIMFYGDYTLFYKWNLNTLMGEPVKNAVGSVIVENLNYTISRDGESYSIPHEIFKEIQVVSGVIEVRFIKKTLEGTIQFDLGAMAPPYFGNARMSLEEAKNIEAKYISFNVSGSPNWDKLFDEISDKEKAKELYTVDGKHFFEVDKVKIKLDLSPVHSYIDKLEEEKEDEKTSKKEENSNQNKKTEVVVKNKNNNPFDSFGSESNSQTPNKEKNTNQNKKTKVVVKNKNNNPFDSFGSGSNSQTSNKNNFSENNPFDKFEASNEEVKVIKDDIKKYIIDRCGHYYIDAEVNGIGRLTLTSQRSSDNRSSAQKERDKKVGEARGREARAKRKEKAYAEKSNFMRNLETIQREWKDKRAGLRNECYKEILRKYSFEYSTNTIDQVMESMFSSTDEFEQIKRITYYNDLIY